MSNRQRNWSSAGRLALAALALLAVTGLGGSANLPAADSTLPDGALRPTSRQRQLAPRIADLFEQMHYSRRRIDDAFSGQVLDRYLDELDGQRDYFTAADVAGFQAWRDRFDDMIHSGQLDPAYLMFATFQQRNRERIKHAIALLDQEPDWTANEVYKYDRAHSPWAASTAELDEQWRLKVKADALSLMLTGKSWSEAAATLHKRYQRVLDRVGQVKGDEVFETLMNAYTTVFDPHSNYFSPRNSEEYRIQMSLSYEGIGASLQMVDDYVTVSNLLAGGPAATDGSLKPNDRIVGVAQGPGTPITEVIGERLDDVVQMIRGKAGTPVRLQILSAGAAPGSEHFVDLVRGKVTLEAQAAKKQLRKITNGDREVRVGVITVPGFYEDVQARERGDDNFRSTTRDVRRLLDEFRREGGIDALVLDLRGDGGGFLPEATALTGLFIDRGPVVQLKNSRGEVEVLNDPDPEPGAAYTGPLTVLVDRTSASASEIFAGAIQDYGRGLIVGQTTFGKGTVQNQIPLDRWPGATTAGQVTVTIGKFYRVTGESTQLRGVTPDIPLPSPIREKDVGEASLDSPLAWDKIGAANFQRVPRPAGPLAVLDAAQARRSASDADFHWLTASLSALTAETAEATLQLNLKQRQLERARLDSARLLRENERRRADGLPPVKSLEELKNADAPDVVLSQAANIAADLINGPVSATTASRAPKNPPAARTTQKAQAQPAAH